MAKNAIFILFLTLFLFSCGKKSMKKDTFILKVKHLEYSRTPDSSKWKNLYKQAHSAVQKRVLVLSAGQTKIKSLFPFVKEIFEKSDDDSLSALAIFAMSQTNVRKSEQYFLKLLNAGSTSPLFKNKIINALGYCGSQRSLLALNAFLDQNQFKDRAFYSLAKLAKKEISDSSALKILFDSTKITPPAKSEAYFIYNSNLSNEQIQKMVKWLPKCQLPVKILLLKKLAKLANTSGTSFFMTDSSTRKILKNFLLITLKQPSSSWRILLPSLSLSRFFQDSIMFNTVKNYLNNTFPSVRIKASEALASIDTLKALPLLTAHITQINATSEKGNICKTIAKIDPATAYLIINQNLDKGSSYFRNILLKALGITKFPLAIRTLYQFLQIDDPLLIEGAFSGLEQANVLKIQDVRNLLNSNYYPVVANAIEWYKRHNKKPEKQILLELFKKFDKPNNVELQLDLARLLEKNYMLSSSEIDSIKIHCAHPYIEQTLYQILGLPFKPKPFPLSILPNYLQPDSLYFKEGQPIVEIQTNKGSFKVELFPDVAPLTVKNFLHLAKHKFYDQLIFHRVVPDFVVQGGDPSGTGWGGTQYLIPSEHSPLSFVRGTVGMATAGFDTGGSQFFICLSEQPHLNGNYTVFGKVVDSMTVVERIEPGDQIHTIKRIR